ncbi:alpha/beta-hydrolase [Rhizodiscina lignyota]|uniref:Alpha/beta-hydrolase n=1 Tax=Rhizodiscina lignyota TaxID=1504668 RepID=A0A9P4ILY6_9PEZI|nr:alpha/beta-hydrolase [Rhizodiscina lignyota]
MPLITVNEKRIHYADWKPDGDARETFVFTHGLGSSQNFYAAVAPILVKDGFRCIAYDTTGSARSPYTQVEQSVESLAEDVIALMDALGVSKAVHAGHSMGGIVSATLAANHSDRIVATIWIGPVYPSPGVAGFIQKRIDAVEAEGMESMANTVPYAAPAANAPTIARLFIREVLLAQDPAGYVSNCRVITSAVRPPYEKIKIPLLLIAGEEDKSASLEGCEKMFDEVSTESGEKRMVVMKGVGHWQCVEAPEETAKLILEFYHAIQ